MLRLAAYTVLLLSLCTCVRAQQEEAAATDPEQNHLAGQQSPYLLQHAGNPVDWYPWGEEALEKAVAEDKLLVISIGYAACHWCHVMEHESFEDTTVAKLMNERFVSVKVDREERPDIDNVYMNACQLTNQTGCGWPLNAIALPDGRPVYLATYLPRDQWLRVLERFAKLREQDPDKMSAYAAELVAELNRMNAAGPEGSEPPRLEVVQEAVRGVLEGQDNKLGGAEGAPKFPSPAVQEFLLAYTPWNKAEMTNAQLRTTLDQMAAGGIYDHLAGGFSRYSTDARWHVPHFEKMLYDNAQLTSLYAHAYQARGEERYAEVVRQTIEFVTTGLSDPAGGFYSSLDADTGGEEGKTYVWTRAEIAGVLGNEQLTTDFTDFYGVTDRGNWEDGKNVLFTKPGTVASPNLREAADKLLVARNQRAQPALDDKVLTAWSALMITGLCDAYRALGEAGYRDRAVRAATFLHDEMTDTDGRLYRNYKGGSAAINGLLDDYAFLAQAYVDVYQVTFDEVWLKRAERLLDYADAHFYNTEVGMYNYTSDLDPQLVTANVPLTDGALPSGNSAYARAAYQLGTLLADEARKARALGMMGRMNDKITGANARFYANWARLYQEIYRPTYEVAILGPAPEAGAAFSDMARRYLPNALFLGGSEEGSLALLEGKLNPEETTIYVCLDKVCKLPVTDVAQALELVRGY